MKHRVSKDIVVTAYITNEDNDVLLVKPVHKEGWVLPGGYVEIGESPSVACQREILAELGVVVERPARLIGIDYHCHTNEYVMFIFDGGVFSSAMINAIVLPPARLQSFQFVPLTKALELLRPNGARRLEAVLQVQNKSEVVYLEQQRPLGM